MSGTYSTEGPQCPHCERQYTADEPFYFDESNYTQETCDQCGKPFAVQVNVSTTWMCEPMDAPDSSAAQSRKEA